jgi:enoyl-CoA hydratase/carnithine racemase
MRRERARELRAAVTHERSEQERLFGSSDFAEGVAAAQERRTALFRGQ